MKRLTDVLARAMIVPVIALFVALVQFIVWGLDRTPPYTELSARADSARSGAELRVRLEVRRELHRRCDADMSRSVFDAAGTRFDLPGMDEFPAARIESIARRTPDAMSVSIVTPTGMAAGRAVLVTTLRYYCNPVHHFFPIVVVSEVPFEVVR